MTGTLTIAPGTNVGLVIHRKGSIGPVVKYYGGENGDTLYGYLGFSDANTPVFYNTSSSANTLLHSGNYTSYKHAYTNLTGSGTTANQAIVSTGTKDGWTLKTLGSRAFDSTAYLPLAGGTMALGKGLKFHQDENYFGTNSDARIISLLDGNGTTCDGGLIIDERATNNGTETITELLRIRDSEFKWKGSDILHANNYTTYTVKKDGTGATGTWGINITGNAATATKLATARTIWGQSFDGTGNIDGKLTITSGGMQVTGTAYFGGGTTYYFGNAGSVNCYQLISNNTATFKNNAILNNSSDPSLTFKDTAASQTIGKIHYVTSYDYDNKKYKSGHFLFRQFSYTADTATKLDYYEDYILPNVNTGLTANAYYTILTTKNYTSYLGYIGTTAVQSSSANQSLTGITNLTISATNSESYIKFSRAKTDSDSYGLNYILAPTNGLLALGVGSNAYNYITAIIDSTSVRPYATGTKDLGTKDACWKSTYTQSIYIPGSASSTAYISSDSSDNLYFKIGTRTPLVLDDSDNAVRAGSSHNNTFSLGTSGIRWKNVYSVLGNFSGQITSTVASGTAPFVVSSTTKVNNLNVHYLDGHNLDFVTARSAIAREAFIDVLFDAVQNRNTGLTVEITDDYPNITTDDNNKITEINTGSIIWSSVANDDISKYLNLFDHSRETYLELNTTTTGIRYTFSSLTWRELAYLFINRGYVSSNANYIIEIETIKSDGSATTVHKGVISWHYTEMSVIKTLISNSNSELRITLIKQDKDASDVMLYQLGFYSTRGAGIRGSNEGFTYRGKQNLTPIINNVWNLGSSSYKWKTIHATTFYGSLSGNATSASKVANALTLQFNGTTNQTYDGSSAKTFNVNLINSGSGLLHNGLTTTIANFEEGSTDTGWKMICPEYSTNGFILKSIRTNSKTPDWILGEYSAGIAFGGGDTKGVISVTYTAPTIEFAGGNKFGVPTWWIKMTGTTGKTYNLDNFLTSRGYIGTTAVQASSAAQALTGITDISMSGNLNITNNGAIHWANGTVQQKITITDDNNPGTAVFSFQQSTNSGSSWSTLTSIYDNGNIYSNKFIGNSYSGNWYKGRDCAAFKTEGYTSGYSPTLSIKTTNGSWEVGTYDNSTFLDKLVFSYVKDDDYNSNTNKNQQILLRNTSGIIALISDITKSQVGLGNVQNTAFYKRIAAVNGTNWEMAGTSNSAAFTIFAPTTAGTAGQVLVSSGSGAPTWGSPSGLTAGSLTPIQLFSGSVSVSSSGWTDIGTGTSTVKFDSRDTGTYAIQITSGTNFVASGVFSVYKNLSNVSDEIPLHVCASKSTRLYLRTMENKLQIASNDTSATSWSITIKIAKIL